MATPLSDGNPLTYDWLNLLVGEVNTLNATSALSRDNTKIKAIPRHYTTSTITNTMQVVTGRYTATIAKTKSRVKTGRVSFPATFSAADVMVIPSINFTGSDPGIDAVCWTVNVDESGCEFIVRRLDKANKKQNVSILINYIAIGKARSTT
jgi:hypothetical protein